MPYRTVIVWLGIRIFGYFILMIVIENVVKFGLFVTREIKKTRVRDGLARACSKRTYISFQVMNPRRSRATSPPTTPPTIGPMLFAFLC